MPINVEQVEAAKDRVTPELMAKPGVVGVGLIGVEGGAGIVILVRHLTPDLSSSLPRQIEGYPAVVEEVGDIQIF